jgi:hypothetical protein
LVNVEDSCDICRWTTSIFANFASAPASRNNSSNGLVVHTTRSADQLTSSAGHLAKTATNHVSECGTATPGRAVHRATKGREREIKIAVDLLASNLTASGRDKTKVLNKQNKWKNRRY